MTHRYIHHRLTAEPRQWRVLADRIASGSTVEDAGGALYGLWRSQIGRPRDEIAAITLWPEQTPLADAESALISDGRFVRSISSEAMDPTLRPRNIDPPKRQGNYAFRWFSTPVEHWDEFLSLCADAWPGFESAYDSQIIGLWRMSGERTGSGADEATGAGLFPGIRSLLLTRRPNLAMWERSKLPEGAAEAKVREALSRRYDLCDWTVVSTSTLLTADDSEDTARWT